VRDHRPKETARTSRLTPQRRGTYAGLVVLLAFALSLGALMSCAPGEDEPPGGNPSGPTQATTRPIEKTGQGRSEQTSSPEPSVAEVVASEIDEGSIRTHLASLTGAAPAQLPGGTVTISERGSLEGRRMTAEYLRSSFAEAGIPARILGFRSADGRGFNVEATLRGREGGKHLWVSAHLDSVYNAGANDNASGLVSILLTAKALERLDLEHTVHFVAFDLEEVGQVGSAVYVGETVNSIRERGGDRAIIGDLNSDMVAYEPDQFNAVVGTCNRAGRIEGAIVRASKELDSPIVLGDYCLGRSDHQRFWEAGLPAAVLTDGARYDGYPWYHTPEDTMDKLNLAYLRSMIQLTATTSALLAAPENAPS
jgi:aminopeptidase YwaD